MGARATWICARATRRGARASDVCKGHILCLYTKILIWCKGLIFCLLKFWNILRPLHHFLWPLHMALAPLLVALALALAPRKMLLFGHVSSICIYFWPSQFVLLWFRPMVSKAFISLYQNSASRLNITLKSAFIFI